MTSNDKNDVKHKTKNEKTWEKEIENKKAKKHQFVKDNSNKK